MFKEILLPFDGLKTTMTSAKYAINLAKLLDARLHVLHIISISAFNASKSCLQMPDRRVRKYCVERTKPLFDEIKKEAKSKKLKNFKIHVAFADSIIKGVVSFTKKQKIDLCIVQPSPYHHSELTGDLARKISRQINIPKLFVKSKGVLSKGSKILVPIDEKKQNLVSMKIAAKLAKQSNSKIILYHTTWREPKSRSQDPIMHCDSQALACLKLAEKHALKEKVQYKIVIEMEKTIEAGIIKCAVRNRADLIVMTSSTAHIGGQPDLVLYNSMHPLLLVRK